MWELTRVLREARVPVQVIVTHRLGRVRYQDRHQVVAVPYVDTNLMGEWQA